MRDCCDSLCDDVNSIIITRRAIVQHNGLTRLPAFFRFFLCCRTLLFYSLFFALRYTLGLIRGTRCRPSLEWAVKSDASFTVGSRQKQIPCTPRGRALPTHPDRRPSTFLVSGIYSNNATTSIIHTVPAKCALQYIPGI